MCVLATASSVHALGTAAGTDIVNTATVTADVGGSPVSASSTPNTITVAELIDVDVTLLSIGNVLVNSPSSARVLTYRVTNTGNGIDAFALSVNNGLAGDDFNPVFAAIYLDANANGVYDVGVDTLYSNGVNDPVLDANLAAQDDIVVFALSDIPAPLVSGDLGDSLLAAASTTGTGLPGDVFPGAGELGTDAIVGTSGGDDSDQGTYQVSAVALTIAKTSAIADPFGGAQPVPGATITYTLTVTVAGVGNADATTLTDAIPANTTYVPGSMMRNAVPLTDAADSPVDEADFGFTTAGAISVGLGSLPAGGPAEVITFQVTID
ncbi:MAG: DUF11 domain-containing protein [Deltaproteobacteria bacterium]|nr:DUF11 domain-containing protein [Deltaproteobacteria bacterium]